MTYIDGFVAAVSNDRKKDYLAHAKTMAAYFKTRGALQIVENWGDDVPPGELTSFDLAVKREEHETVVFSWVVWPSKAVRDEGWAAMMADPTMKEEGANMPLDGKRLIYGGFETILDL